MKSPKRMRGTGAKTILLSCILLLLSGIFPAEGRQNQHWFGDFQMNRLFILLNTFFKEAVLAPETEEAEQLAALYIAQYDPYAKIYSADQYHAFQQSFSTIFGGVQMEIQALDNGKIICHPSLGGAAAKAGINEADQLLAIDGVAVTGMEIHIIGMNIRGQPDTNVQLTVQTDGQPPREVSLTRNLTRARSVWHEKLGPHPTCRIHSFTNQTPYELRRCVTKLAGMPFLLLDLRGNPGGDLDAAIEAAAIFLPKGREIATIISKNSTVVRSSENEHPFRSPSLILLQDGHTASAAEVFIAALTQNQEAISLGARSFGKGVTQKFIEFTDGSAILLSYARLLPPGKTPYHGKGLAPTITIATPSPLEESSSLLARLDRILVEHSVDTSSLITNNKEKIHGISNSKKVASPDPFINAHPVFRRDQHRRETRSGQTGGQKRPAAAGAE